MCVMAGIGRDPLAWRMVTVSMGSKNKNEPKQVQAPLCFGRAVSELSRMPVIIVVKNKVPSGDKNEPPVRLWLLLEYDAVQRTIRYAEFYERAVVQKSIPVSALKEMMISL